MNFFFKSRRVQMESTGVIALHCSGANGNQWRSLADTLGPEHHVIAPNQYGCASRGDWHGQTAFCLAAEANPTIETIDAMEGPVHLVGHSYGGGLALHIAMQRPRRIASLSLYEPSAFYLLPQLREEGRIALVEISAIAAQVRDFVVTGDFRSAAETFVDYWSGSGSWDAMRSEVQDALVSWSPKAPLDFHALFTEPATFQSLRHLEMPVLLMCGEKAPCSTRTIVEALERTFVRCRSIGIQDAGHMGPLTHASEVNAAIAEHISSTTVILNPAAGTSSTTQQTSRHDGWRLAS